MGSIHGAEKISWRKKWQPTSILLPKKITWTEERGGYSPWGCRELDTIEQPSKHDINMQERNSTMNE